MGVCVCVRVLESKQAVTSVLFIPRPLHQISRHAQEGPSLRSSCVHLGSFYEITILFIRRNSLTLLRGNTNDGRTELYSVICYFLAFSILVQ